MPGTTGENWNTRLNSSVGQNKSAIENVLGTIEVVNTLLPAGTNTTVGAYEDQKNSTIITCNSNSNGDHAIYRYYPDTSTWHLVKQDPRFNFQVGHNVYDMDLIGDILYYHDDINPPRRINVVMADDTNKNTQFNIYFGSGKTNVFSKSGDTWGLSYTTNAGSFSFPL